MAFINAVRIVNVDFYMTPPVQGLDVMYSDFKGSSINQVPVIRIFGSTNTGKKICLHIHGVFPYLYIPYDGSEHADSLKYQIAASIDKALNISFGQASSSSQHVYKISLVSGIPLYGYHGKEHQFLKIFLFNPSLIRKVGNLLQNEVILGRLYQPHESHIPFILQFMIDYNLHGMSNIVLSELKFRADLNQNTAVIDSDLFHQLIPKGSVSELEADVLSEHILNRLEVAKGNMAINPGIAALWEDEKQRRRNKNESSQIGPCLTLKNLQVAPTKSHLIFKKALLEKLSISENLVEKVDQNISVYPAETPQNKTIINASLIDFHSPLSSQSSNETVHLNSTLDDKAKNLYEILQDLGDNAESEEDSILTQLQNEDDYDYLDLSISMEDITPVKNMLNQKYDDSESEQLNDSLDTTLVPQLDGHCDGESSSSDECDQNSHCSQKTKKPSSKYVALPIYVSSPTINNKNQDLQEDVLNEKIYDNYYDNVKRKLNFTSSLPEITVYEENLECQIRSEYKEKICGLEQYQIPNTELIPETTLGNEEILNVETDSSLVLCAAQLYDFQTNFKAKEGSSKKFSQNSENYELKLSSESSCDSNSFNTNQIAAKKLSNPLIVSQEKLSSDKVTIPSNLECLIKSENKKQIYLASKEYINIPEDNLVNREVSNVETDRSVELCAAQLYDFQTNFQAKEGSSKIFTQNSENDDLKLSFGPNCNENVSNSNEVVTNYSSSNCFVPQKESIEEFDGKIQSQVNSSETNIKSAKENLQNTSELQLSLEDKQTLQNSDVITPCQHGIVDKKEKAFRSFSNNCLITPQRKPPTKNDIINRLDEFNIPKILHESPYYSNVEDVTGSVEIGHSVLKIPSRTTAHVEDFKTYFEGLDAFRKRSLPENVKWSYENIKSLKLSFCRAANCIITPLKHPPTAEEVKKWIKNKNTAAEEMDIKKNKEKTKIHVPVSPGALDESDLELSLTISPCDSDSIELVQSDSTGVTSPVVGKASRKRKKLSQDISNHCQITGVSLSSLNNTYGFKVTPENYQNAKAVNEFQYVTILSLELHIQTRGDLKPDPSYDSIRALFYSIKEDVPEAGNKTGIIAVNNSFGDNSKFSLIKDSEVSCEAVCVESEQELLNEFVKLILKWDPDILVGYEIEMLSWGYLIDRANSLGCNLLSALSRIKNKPSRNHEDDRNLTITGRTVLNIWRLLRHEVALTSYTFESIVYHILHKRIPLYSFKDLSSWWDDRSSLYRHRTISHYLFRVEGILEIMEKLDIIGRTSELARLFGIQFFEVLSRGSQFRVESMMLRLAKPLNYIPVSPSVQQRAKMKAPEFLPLILEPESKLYVDPVIVLDFQSLYPSMIIAYNYCFSTCIGNVIHLGKNAPFEFGTTQLKVSRARVQKLVNRDCLNFSPCGAAFVKSHMRDGILPRMLREILDTRLMVKNAMKNNKEDRILQKVLHSRQLGLKLIANVTYGYTAANFSGRMPAVELADSVVSKGRETLQRAIAMVENTPEWRAKVVYGDTDSLFVLVAGKSRTEAFEIGKKIAEAITNDNPDPVKLKLEKVYHPCILQTKKRYVGYMYESPDQPEPIYDAKGIETVRRDGCPAVAKMLEKCLRLLFETKNVSLVKKYVVRQFHKIMIGRVSLQDLTFAKEYRGASGYRPGACVPALELARKWTSLDRRNEPRRGERVPYVIASGPPGVPLIRLVHSPREFLSEPSLRPNAFYYITKVVIPPINRCFNLIGADLATWFNQMPRKQLQNLPNSSPAKKSTISQYFVSTNCAACGEQTQNNLCDECINQSQDTFVVLHEKIRQWEHSYCNTNLICQSCTGILDKDVCISLDCPVLYRVNQTVRDLQQAVYVRQVLDSLPCEF